MKYIKEYMREELMVEPLGSVTFEECPDGENVGYRLKICGKHTDIVVWWADYASWLEKKIDMMGGLQINQQGK